MCYQILTFTKVNVLYAHGNETVTAFFSGIDQQKLHIS